jgi:hypothetical protein
MESYQEKKQALRVLVYYIDEHFCVPRLPGSPFFLDILTCAEQSVLASDEQQKLKDSFVATARELNRLTTEYEWKHLSELR